MANHRRNRTRGHDPHAHTRNAITRAEARGEKPSLPEGMPEGYTGDVPQTAVFSQPMRRMGELEIRVVSTVGVPGRVHARNVAAQGEQPEAPKKARKKSGPRRHVSGKRK